MSNANCLFFLCKNILYTILIIWQIIDIVWIYSHFKGKEIGRKIFLHCFFIHDLHLLNNQLCFVSSSVVRWNKCCGRLIWFRLTLHFNITIFIMKTYKTTSSNSIMYRVIISKIEFYVSGYLTLCPIGYFIRLFARLDFSWWIYPRHKHIHQCISFVNIVALLSPLYFKQTC